MSELEARQLLESAQHFVEAQRVQRVSETKLGYMRDGAHVVVGHGEPLSDNFVPSNHSEPESTPR